MKNILILIILILLPCFLAGQETDVSEQPGIESELSITVNPNNPDEIIIASMGSGTPILLYNSNDGGDNWNQISFGNGVADPVLTYGDNNTAYLTYLDFGNTLEMYLARSANNGADWITEQLTLDGLAADRQWIKRDNSVNSPHYGNIYLGYFHPEQGRDIHIVKIDETGNVGENHPVHETAYGFVQNPAIDISLDGTIIVCFIAGDENGDLRIVSVNSTDGSNTFSPESTLADLYMYNSSGDPVIDVVGFAPGDASRLGNSLQMAIDKSSGEFSGRTYLSWTDFIDGAPNEGMNIYLSFSDNNGVSWSTPMVVNDDGIPSSHQYYAGIDVNPAGVVCLSWYDRRNDPTNDALTDFYFSYSSDGGLNFQPSIKVNTVSSDHNAVTDGLITFGVGEYTSLATTETDAYVVWSDGRENNGDMDVYFAKISFDNVNDIHEVALRPSLLFTEVFPNPVINGQVQLMLNSLSQEEVSISIIDVNGQIVKADKGIDVQAGENILGVNVAELPYGSYIVKVIHNDGIASKKITIANKH